MANPTPGPAVQDFYLDAFAHCYGCGRLNPEGHHLRSFPRGEEVVARVTPRAHDTSFPGFAYGGFLASMLDCHSMATAAAAAHRAQGRTLGVEPLEPFVTASLKVDYLRPTPIGVPLDVVGRAVRVAGRKVDVEAHVAAGGSVCVKAQVLAVLMPETMRGHGSR